MERTVDHQIDHAIGAGIRTRRYRGEETRSPAPGNDAVIEPLAHTANVRHRDGGLLHRDVDVLALAADRAAVERDHAAHRCVGRRHHVGLGASQLHRRVFFLSGDVHRSAERTGHDVRGLEAPVGSRLTEIRDRGEDEAGVQLAQIPIAQTETLQKARPKGLQNHVRGFRQPPEEPLPFRSGDV